MTPSTPLRRAVADFARGRALPDAASLHQVRVAEIRAEIQTLRNALQRPDTEDRDAEIIFRVRNDGESITVIALEYSLTEDEVRATLERAGVPADSVPRRTLASDMATALTRATLELLQGTTVTASAWTHGVRPHELRGEVIRVLQTRLRSGREERDAEVEYRHVVDRELPSEIMLDLHLTQERIRQILRARSVPSKISQDIRNERNLVDWTCGGCGHKERRGGTEALHKFCNTECRDQASKDRERTPWTGPDGHQWVYCPYHARNVRYQRHLMARKLGRALRTEEEVHLKDGNPQNVTLENIEVRMVNRPTRVGILRELIAHVEEHGDLPQLSEAQAMSNLPTVQTITQVFGSGTWTEAMTKVAKFLGIDSRYIGSKPNKNRKYYRGRRVTRTEVVSAFGRWHKRNGAIPTFMEARNNPELPGPAAVRTALGVKTWAEVRDIVQSELGLAEATA